MNSNLNNSTLRSFANRENAGGSSTILQYESNDTFNTVYTAASTAKTHFPKYILRLKNRPDDWIDTVTDNAAKANTTFVDTIGEETKKFVSSEREKKLLASPGLLEGEDSLIQRNFVFLRDVHNSFINADVEKIKELKKVTLKTHTKGQSTFDVNGEDTIDFIATTPLGLADTFVAYLVELGGSAMLQQLQDILFSQSSVSPGLSFIMIIKFYRLFLNYTNFGFTGREIIADLIHSLSESISYFLTLFKKKVVVEDAEREVKATNQNIDDRTNVEKDNLLKKKRIVTPFFSIEYFIELARFCWENARLIAVTFVACTTVIVGTSIFISIGGHNYVYPFIRVPVVALVQTLSPTLQTLSQQISEQFEPRSTSYHMGKYLSSKEGFFDFTLGG